MQKQASETRSCAGKVRCLNIWTLTKLLLAIYHRILELKLINEYELKVQMFSFNLRVITS